MVVVVVVLVQEVHRSAFNAALSNSTACVHAKMMTVDKYNRIVGCIRKLESGSTVKGRRVSAGASMEKKIQDCRH